MKKQKNLKICIPLRINTEHRCFGRHFIQQLKEVTFFTRSHNASVQKTYFSNRLFDQSFLSYCSNYSLKSSFGSTAVCEKSFHLLSAGSSVLVLCWVIWVHELCQVLFPNVPVIPLEREAGGELENNSRYSLVGGQTFPQNLIEKLVHQGSAKQWTQEGFS